MVKLVYDENSVLDAKNNFKTYSENIIEALNNINNEYQSIDNILNTPKSQKGVPVYLDYFKNNITYLSENINNFDTLYDALEKEYKEHVESVRKMVGSNYEEK